MKKIFIATDFSPAAHNAALYGVQLAAASRAEVVLFTSYHVARPFGAQNVPVSHLAAMEETKAHLHQEAGLLTAAFQMQLELVCEEGAACDTILALAAEKEADLIIVGMTGSGRNLKNLFGSTTTALLRTIGIPVLVVPQDAHLEAFDRILYASDVFLDTSLTQLDGLEWLTGLFSSRLFVVRVVKDSYEELREVVNTPPNLRRELKRMETTFHFPINASPTDGLIAFVKDQNIDLMIMIPRRHEWMERLLERNTSAYMVFHSHIPLLMLPETAAAAEPLISEAGKNYSSEK